MKVEYTKLLTTKDVLQVLECSPQTIQSAISRKKLRVHSHIQGMNLYTVDDVYAWVQSRRRGATPTLMDNLTKEEFLQRCKDIGLDYCEF